MQQLLIHDPEQTGITVPFAMQPILTNNHYELFGYELLYRGKRPAHWPDIDLITLNYLRTINGSKPNLFINLCNETILTQDLSLYLPPAIRDTTYIELTETFIDINDYKDVARRVNAFSELGIKFAIDDFGSGFDGLHRLAALEYVSFIKLDRDFLQHAATNKMTQRSLRSLIDHWTSGATGVIAEGIETPAELAFANQLHVQMFQGYLIDDIFQDAREPHQDLSRAIVHDNRAMAAI